MQGSLGPDMMNLTSDYSTKRALADTCEKEAMQIPFHYQCEVLATVSVTRSFC